MATVRCSNTMYEQWPFFQSTLDLIEMVLAKADARIAAEYDRRLVPRISSRSDASSGRGWRARPPPCSRSPATPSRSTRRQCCDDRLTFAIRTSIPINLVQIELLARLRQSPDNAELMRAFVVDREWHRRRNAEYGLTLDRPRIDAV